MVAQGKRGSASAPSLFRDCLSSRLVSGLFTPCSFGSTTPLSRLLHRLQLLVQHYPWPYEPRIFLVRLLSFMYKIDSDIAFMCRTYTEIQVHQVFWCCCWSKLGLWVGRRLGWGGDRKINTFSEKSSLPSFSLTLTLRTPKIFPPKLYPGSTI